MNREGDYKLIYYWEYDHVELYNLKKEKGEINNLSKTAEFNLKNEE